MEPKNFVSDPAGIFLFFPPLFFPPPYLQPLFSIRANALFNSGLNAPVALSCVFLGRVHLLPCLFMVVRQR